MWFFKDQVNTVGVHILVLITSFLFGLWAVPATSIVTVCSWIFFHRQQPTRIFGEATPWLNGAAIGAISGAALGVVLAIFDPNG